MAEKILIMAGWGIISPKYDTSYKVATSVYRYGSVVDLPKWPGWGHVAEFVPNNIHSLTVKDLLKELKASIPEYLFAVVIINEETKQFQVTAEEGIDRYDVLAIWQGVAAKYPPPPPKW